MHGFIHMYEDTPEFIARNVVREAKAYLESLPPPFFRALVPLRLRRLVFVALPGHSGGVAFLKSPVGQMFHQFFGENMLRADVCNAVEELGQLLDHTGPVAASERNAARIFNCDHLYFVTNGTSTSNKIVWHSTVAPGDIVVVDRNCHKSVLHAIMMTGAIPVFLMPTRNNFGIIGPIPRRVRLGEHPEEDRRQPFIADKTAKPRVLTITQSTYDGVLCNVEAIRTMLDGKIDTCTSTRPGCPTPPSTISTATTTPSAPTARCRESMVFSTQSTPQAAGRPVPGLADPGAGRRQNAPRPRRVQRGLPHAHLHLAAVRDHRLLRRGGGDDGRARRHRAGRGIHRRGPRLPPRHAQGGRGMGRRLVVQGVGPGRPVEEGIEERDAWMLKPGERWHGFGDLAEGFNMLDPIKATIITPGLDVDGEFAERGIPAAIVTKLPGRARRDRRRPACTASSSCSPSASPRAAGTAW